MIKKHPIPAMMLAGLLIGALIIFAGRQNADENKGEEYKIKELVESLDGVDNASVLISRSETGTVQTFSTNSNERPGVAGIAVTASGADVPKNRQKIIELLCAAYSLPANRIFVCGK